MLTEYDLNFLKFDLCFLNLHREWLIVYTCLASWCKTHKILRFFKKEKKDGLVSGSSFMCVCANKILF